MTDEVNKDNPNSPIEWYDESEIKPASGPEYSEHKLPKGRTIIPFTGVRRPNIRTAENGNVVNLSDVGSRKGGPTGGAA